MPEWAGRFVLAAVGTVLVGVFGVLYLVSRLNARDPVAS